MILFKVYKYNGLMILLITVGALFSFFSMLLAYSRFYYSRYAKEVRGRIVAIEKLQRRSYSGRSNRTSTLYYPIVEYSFQGRLYWFRSFGSNNALSRYPINQVVSVLSLDLGPEYVMLKNGITMFMASIFGVAGLLCLGFGINKIKDISSLKSFDFIFVIFISIVFIKILFKVKKYFKDNPNSLNKRMLKNVTIVDKKSLEGRDVYYSEVEVQKELTSFRGIKILISSLFLLGTSFGSFYFLSKLDRVIQEQMINFLKYFENYKELNQLFTEGNPMFLGFLFCVMMTLFSIYGLFDSLKKRG